jgi:pilus assembly protein Flp/PilA
MTKLIAIAKKFVREEEGASLAEYGLLLALVAVFTIASIKLLGNSISSIFTTVSSSI